MTAAEIINEVQENISEWLEMSDKPEVTLLWAIAQKAANYKSHIEYLEKRLAHDSRKVRVN